MNDFNREQAFINIYSMNNIIRSLSDEELMESWLVNGVPDGSETLDDIKAVYGCYDDNELMYEYEALTHLFGRIVKAAVEDGYEMWTFIGQKLKRKVNEHIIY